MRKTDIALKIDVTVTASIFRRFALFNAFIKQRRWISPVIFACLMTGFACIAIIAKDRSNQAMLLFYVLLSIGFLLPLVYVFGYLISVNTQIKAMKLSASPRYVYTLSLDLNSIEAVVNEARQVYSWRDIHAVYKKNDCTYLYVSPQRAFLLPNDHPDTEALWEMLRKAVPPRALH